MLIGVPREIKTDEARVALTATGATELVAHGHEVLIETGAGVGSGIPDAAYEAAGARIVASAAEAWAAQLVLKVKEPIAAELDFLRDDLTLFAYLHLAAAPELAQALIERGTTAIAYETVRAPDGSLPMLAPMSEVAGRLSVTQGASLLTAPQGGAGLLLGGVPGTRAGHTVVLGGGVAGTAAVEMAVGLGSRVTVLDVSLPRLRQFDTIYGGRVQTLHSNRVTVEESVRDADLVIGSVLIPGAKAPKLVTNEMVAGMRPGSVLVDIAIDQGGCFADSRPTTHREPTFRVHETVFACVANLPGAVPRTSTEALTNATLHATTRLADLGWRAALTADAGLAAGLNTSGGHVANAAVAAALETQATPLATLLG
ncbi:alanine dehydrogenase [Agrococcus sp. ARC_14]|uniref:alanine dehydrogenase n=1 Tax=Agrococcus sp. ARC_14 TaxID=2919927 RepID=UPI001F063EF3|nr:alanine dehydrogenase [Agrococcus sp. ARC_14]MCH1883672.1 alanine dehydrogenase [Agrococcus sp. ARC_14]